MKERSHRPLSVRTQQISALSAFVPFVICLMAAIVKYLPLMPVLSFWSKTTFFLIFPMFFGLTGAFVGFLIGLMLDSIEAQSRYGPKARRDDGHKLTSGSMGMSMGGVKGSVWVAVEDLEPNQRVAETVVGENGSPLLLRHTLLKPAHLELLRNQNIKKIKVEVMKYPGDGDFALAG